MSGVGRDERNAFQPKQSGIFGVGDGSDLASSGDFLSESNSEFSKLSKCCRSSGEGERERHRRNAYCSRAASVSGLSRRTRSAKACENSTKASSFSKVSDWRGVF